MYRFRDILKSLARAVYKGCNVVREMIDPGLCSTKMGMFIRLCKKFL